MIQISPHMENAQIAIAPTPSPMPDSEEPESFAEILAGLVRRTGTIEAETSADVELEADGIPLADMEVSEAGDGMSAAAFVLKKNQGIEQTAAEPGPKQAAGKAGGEADGKAEDSGTIKAELSEIDFSEEEQNLLVGTAQFASRIALEFAQANSPAIDAVNGDDAALETAPVPEFAQADSSVIGAAIDDDAALEVKPVPEFAQANSFVIGNANDDEAAPEKAPPLEFASANSPAIGAADGDIGIANNADKAEKEGKTIVGEARGRDKRRGFAVEVRDFRTGNAQGEGGQKSGELRVLANAETRQTDEGGHREITLELRLPDQPRSSAETAWEAKSGQALDDLLARELHQNFNNDIVRHASMALRDNGEGTIRLALRPESLGNVKIRLEMAENKITGHIVVESEEALRAFERETRSLEQAFRDSGFESANLEMSLAPNLWQGNGGAERQWRETETGRFLSGQMAASQYDAALERADGPLAVIDWYRSLPGAVNVFA